ncbi:MAG: dipeptide/oligopeptide/nickel ABC transporter permease/ATP-binding protein [Actinobacteria bacterium]|nr:dipeptide/oligopeptide/nickel ABC transporter permease/ATP-binding protein [Actinomycetota bacterium]
MHLGPVGVSGLVLLGTLAAVALAAPVLAPFDPSDRVGVPFSRPGALHLLGTNDVGQDLLSELIFGARVSLAVGLAAAVAATAAGTAVGLTAGYARGWVDTVLMRVVDVMLALPFLPLAIVVGVVLGPGLVTLVALIAATTWAGAARALRSQVLSLRERDHVAAARAMGAGGFHVLRRHVLVDVAPLVVPQFVLAAKTAILLEASLSFLGLGDPTSRSWGTTLSFAFERSAFLTDAWLWWVVPPGVCIALAVLGFALVGCGIEGIGSPHAVPPPDRQSGVAASPSVVAGGRAPVLEVAGLSVRYDAPAGAVEAVSGVCLTVAAGEVVGLIGESGSGKSTLVMAAAGLLRPPARITGGAVFLDGDDLAALSAAELRRRRGNRVALVPQQAMSALNPVLRVGEQVAEVVRAHQPVTRAQAHARASELLALVGIDPGRAGDHPHRFSGGRRQRVVIAMALANDPALLVADEPTTGLDLVTAADVLQLLASLQARLGMALLLVSHDVGAVLTLASRVAVLQDGKVVEEGPTARVAAHPSHPHTRALLDAVPRLRPPSPALVASRAR